MKIFALIAIWMVGLPAVLFLWRREAAKQRSVERLASGMASGTGRRRPESSGDLPAEALGWRKPLFEAGYRSPFARKAYLWAVVVCLALGVSTTFGLRGLGAFDLMEARLRRFPAGLGDVFLPLFWAAPWAIPAFFAALPLIVLHRLRLERQRSMAEDLPVTLELLAILCESGLGFDAALEALIRAQVRPRPLARELRGFLVDARAGRPRVQSFRRLGHRVGLVSFETFIASMIQAEQAGAPMAEALRRQAYAMREQRREKAMEAAMSLPVKRMLPMAICFLPALFIVSLGPIFYDILQFFDALALRRAAF